MRTFNRIKSRGFTLVELMIVVAIIGVLAALAIFGVRKYLASAKSAEARNSLGAINRGSIAAYERENALAEQIIPGGTSSATTHALCGTTTDAVPTTIASVKGVKYVSKVAAGEDYGAGSATAGWSCLKFEMHDPQYYMYHYTKGAAGINAKKATATGWSAEAQGDLDGNAIIAEFTLTGDVVGGHPIAATTISEVNPEE